MATHAHDTRATADDARPSRSTGAPSIPYEPALDGLRAVAVIAVLLYHGGVTWMRGGFLGVDLFFVLSGYLITTLLLVEWGRNGTLRLSAFWVRRARRLLPALGLVLVGVVGYAAFVVDRTQLPSIRNDAFATIAYVANWRFVFSGQSYFAQFAAPSPLRHMWSLAIEEQFYLLWPFVVFLLLRWRPRLRLLTQLFVGAAVASALLMAVLFHPGHDPSRVYYGTDTRAQALLIGAALATILLRVRRSGRERPAPSAPWVRGGLVGALVLAVALIAVRDSAEWMYRGGYLLAAIACAATIAAAVQPRRNILRVVLSPAPLRAIGKVSYGLYLWHWPVYLALTEERLGLSGYALLLARVAVSAGLAVASYYLVELPVRRGTWLHGTRRALVVVPAVAAVLALAFVLVPAVRGTGRDIAIADLSTVTTVAGSATPPASVLVVGDSVAKTLGDGFDRESHTAGVSLFNRGQLACGLAQHARIHHGDVWSDTEPTCDDWPAHWTGWINEIHPVVSVVVFDVYVVQDLEINGQSVPFGSKASDTYIRKQLGRGIDNLRAGGGAVVILTAPYNHRPEVVGQPVHWAEDDTTRIDHWNALMRAFVKKRADPAVTLVDLNGFVSPGGAYANSLNGVALRYDGVHFNPNAGQLVFRWLLPQLPSKPA
jgi:peptidoglycan/LPS O-acetylase OafA/YrhL